MTDTENKTQVRDGAVGRLNYHDWHIWTENGRLHDRLQGLRLPGLMAKDSLTTEMSPRPTMFADRATFNSWCSVIKSKQHIRLAEALMEDPLNGFFTIPDEYLKALFHNPPLKEWKTKFQLIRNPHVSWPKV